MEEQWACELPRDTDAQHYWLPWGSPEPGLREWADASLSASSARRLVLVGAERVKHPFAVGLLEICSRSSKASRPVTGGARGGAWNAGLIRFPPTLCQTPCWHDQGEEDPRPGASVPCVAKLVLPFVRPVQSMSCRVPHAYSEES